MKHYSKIFLLLSMAACWLAGCEKDENRNFFLGGTNPVLSANKTNLNLAPQMEKDEAIRLNWSNPNYLFGTGVSSHDVTYSIDFAVNSSFNSGNIESIVLSKSLGRSFTVKEINSIMANKLSLPIGVESTVFVRVESSIRFENGAKNGQLFSNIISFKAIPYPPPPAVDLPSQGKLWLVGSATANGWANPTVANQEFKQISNTLYEITIPLVGGGSYLMLPVNGDWGDKYGWAGANNGNNPLGDKLARGGGDVLAPGTGTYKISVDFQVGRFTVTPQ